MALVLKARKKGGEITRFDVVRAGNAKPAQILNGITAGRYTVLTDQGTVEEYQTSYRTVQDTVKVS